jgi:demethylmenaquinone methyltransferase/2-methoxy-6-polyprenyl-1,4-benzoquinol methylase
MPTDHAGDRNRFAQELFSSLPKRYDQLAEVLSMGQNRRWRRAMVDHIAPSSPALILDVGLPCNSRRAPHLTSSAWI